MNWLTQLMTTIVLADPLPEVFAQLVGDEFDLRYFALASADDVQQTRGIVVYGHQLIDAALMDRCPSFGVIVNHDMSDCQLDESFIPLVDFTLVGQG